MTFKFEHYLDRIGLTDVPAGATGLAAVQHAHMRAIPFENIDPLLGRVPSLALEDITAKLVTGRRGGYCFEHNALFGQVLTALGYAPRAVLARVFDRSGRSGARSHHAFTVESEEETWLCDTGFGGHGALVPLRLTTPAPQAAPNGTYRVRADPASGETALDRQAGEDWVPLYAFDTAPVRDIDFEAANYLCARWEDAPFSANLMVAVHSDAGRLALFNRAVTRGCRRRRSKTTWHRRTTSASCSGPGAGWISQGPRSRGSGQRSRPHRHGGERLCGCQIGRGSRNASVWLGLPILRVGVDVEAMTRALGNRFFRHLPLPVRINFRFNQSGGGRTGTIVT